MKYSWVFICCAFFFLFGCANKNRANVHTLLSSDNEAVAFTWSGTNHFIHDDGKRRVSMNFDDARLGTVRIVDRDAPFEFIIVFYEDSSIHSFIMGSYPSNYGIHSMFFFSDDHLLYRVEQIGNLRIVQQVFKDGRVEFSTSFLEKDCLTPPPCSNRRGFDWSELLSPSERSAD